MLQSSDTHDLFDWLRSLSFIESRRDGVFPHDLAREALLADLRWRNLEWYAELHRRARGFYLSHINQTSGQDQQRILWDYIFLHRDNPVIKPFFEWQASASVISGPMRPKADIPALVEMVRRHEGEESAGWANYWLEKQPQNVIVMRDSQHEPAGFMSWIDLNLADPAAVENDPATRAAVQYFKTQPPLRPGERTVLFRHWMARETYQDVSPVQSLLFVNLVRYYLTTSGVAFTFFPTANTDFWAPGFAYGDLHRTPEADWEMNGRHYGVFTHDWRAVPPLAWLDLMAEREMGKASEAASATPNPQASPAFAVLDQETFSEAVREALRHFTRPESLRGNPLLRTRLVYAGNANRSEIEQAQRLRTLIQQAADTFHGSPRDEKLFRVLEKTYFHPAPTQEAAAELLDLPFSTYRRHLKSAVERITEMLWIQEIGK